MTRLNKVPLIVNSGEYKFKCYFNFNKFDNSIFEILSQDKKNNRSFNEIKCLKIRKKRIIVLKDKFIR